MVPELVRHTTRPSKPPTWLRDYVCCSYSSSSSPLEVGQYPLSFSFTSHHLPCHTQFFVASTSHIPEPKNYIDTLKDERWVAAKQQEILALESNFTWDVGPLPLGKTPIGCKWVLKVKYNSDGMVERSKLILLDKGLLNRRVLPIMKLFLRLLN